MITVYHLNSDQFEQRVLLRGISIEKGYYTPVAKVDTQHIGTAFGLTRHPEPSGSWPDHKRVKAQEASHYRSSMVGDVLEHSDGCLYMVLGMGYKQVHWGDAGIKPYTAPCDVFSEEFLYEFDDE